MGKKFSEPCTPYQNHHHQLTVERKRAGSDGKSLLAASNGMSNINLLYHCNTSSEDAYST